MGHCETCAFWQKPEDIGDEWGSCLRGHSVSGDLVYKETLAVAQDADGHRASMNTKAKFGCVMHAG